MKTEYVNLKTAALSCNCPECFATDGLVLSFEQKHKNNKLLHKITKEVTENLSCKKCNLKMYPVRWTDDIERLYEYHKKTIQPKSARLRFKGLFYILILITVIIGVAGYLYLNKPEVLGL